MWKPSPAATYSNYLVYQILAEAGVPPGVIQFVPGPPPEVVAQAIGHPHFAALHFTGSTFVFKKLWKDISANIDNYRSYPRIVGETGGKNFHIIHSSAEIRNAVLQSIRGGFEYQGRLPVHWCKPRDLIPLQDKSAPRFQGCMSLPRSGPVDSKNSYWLRSRRSELGLPGTSPTSLALSCNVSFLLLVVCLYK